MAASLLAILRLTWPLTFGIRWYWIHSRRKWGKRLLVDVVLKRLVPPAPEGFVAELPGGGQVFLHHREDIGLAYKLSGAFEPAELEFVRMHAAPNTTAIDVGANIGIFTVPLALAVGNRGNVVAIEPEPENARRCLDNVLLNDVDNVQVRVMAAGDRAGVAHLAEGRDPAFHSVEAAAESTGTLIRVETLDEIWTRAGSPRVSLVKIDTEGGEQTVLRGSTRMLGACHPVLLVEAKERADVRWVDEFLSRFGYTRMATRGFAVGNHAYKVATDVAAAA
jgi:FkbM family methyltransferase